MSDVALRVDHLEEHDEERKRKLEEVEGRLDEHSSEIQSIDQWRKGNGAQGAEARLREMEVNMGGLSALVEKVASDESIARIAQVAVKEVIGNARGRDRTAISKVKAFAPYFAAGCALVAALVATVIK